MRTQLIVKLVLLRHHTRTKLALRELIEIDGAVDPDNGDDWETSELGDVVTALASVHGFDLDRVRIEAPSTTNENGAHRGDHKSDGLPS